MTFEIERKFLVKNKDFKQQCFKNIYINQGYLSTKKNKVVRIRIQNNRAFLTIKGKSNKSGTTRFEWEKEILVNDAKQLLLLSNKDQIEKYRYYINYKGFIYEVDEFLGDNKGLIVAELELDHEKTKIEKPNWLGQEITGEKKYYNASLIKKPFKNWKK